MVKNLKNNDKLSCDQEGSSLGPLQFTGPDKSVLADQLIVQTVMACGVPPGLKGKEMWEWAIPKVDLMKDIKPQGGVEGMLAAQMVATHNAAMECFNRAMVPNQSSLACDQYFKHAAKLLSIYTRQMAALDKHRGKGQQKVRVEHVNVEAGGPGNGRPHRNWGEPKATTAGGKTHTKSDP